MVIVDHTKSCPSWYCLTPQTTPVSGTMETKFTLFVVLGNECRNCLLISYIRNNYSAHIAIAILGFLHNVMFWKCAELYNGD